MDARQTGIAGNPVFQRASGRHAAEFDRVRPDVVGNGVNY
jgi:hypothetical protein